MIQSSSGREPSEDINDNPSDHQTPPCDEMLDIGNFPEWINAIEAILQSHGLWQHVQDPAILDGTLSEDERHELETNDASAINTILNQVKPEFLARISIPRPITAYELVRKLENDAKPFRLRDLPRELRDKIYEFSMVDPWYAYYRKPRDMRDDEAITAENVHRCWFRPKLAAFFEEPQRVFIAKQPSLLQISRQIRDEADEVYWAKNVWEVSLDFKFLGDYDHGLHIFWDIEHAQIDFQQWVDLIGMHRLRHLRDLTVFIDLSAKAGRHHHVCEFRVTYDGCRGLEVNLPDKIPGNANYPTDRLDWHLAVTEYRRKQNGWKGEGIIDYFTGDPEFWSTYFFAHPFGDDDHDEEEEEYGYYYEYPDEREQTLNSWWSTCFSTERSKAERVLQRLEGEWRLLG